MPESKDDLEGRIQSDIQREILSVGGESASKPYSLIFFDIDHFKAFNDLYSYKQGDEVLNGVRYLLKRLHNEGQFIGVYGNYGGDEFLIALPAASIDESVNVIQKLQKVIGEHQFLDTSTKLPLQELVSLSFGVGCVDLLQYVSTNLTESSKRAFDDLLRQSNIALDYGKVLGEGGVQVFKKFLDEEWNRVKELREIYFKGPFYASFESNLNSIACPEDFKLYLLEDFALLRKRLTSKDTRTLAQFADRAYRQHLLEYSGDKHALISALRQAAGCR